MASSWEGQTLWRKCTARENWSNYCQRNGKLVSCNNVAHCLSEARWPVSSFTVTDGFTVTDWGWTITISIASFLKWRASKGSPWSTDGPQSNVIFICQYISQCNATRCFSRLGNCQIMIIDFWLLSCVATFSFCKCGLSVIYIHSNFFPSVRRILSTILLSSICSCWKPIPISDIWDLCVQYGQAPLFKAGSFDAKARRTN